MIQNIVLKFPINIKKKKYGFKDKCFTIKKGKKKPFYKDLKKHCFKDSNKYFKKGICL